MSKTSNEKMGKTIEVLIIFLNNLGEIIFNGVKIKWYNIKQLLKISNATYDFVSSIIAIWKNSKSIPTSDDTFSTLTASSLREKQVTFLRNVAKLIDFSTTLPGYELTGGELHRTQEQQDIYIKQGKTKVKYSKHQDRLAIDLILYINGVWRTDKISYKPLADYWKSLHPSNTSGYDWDWDYNHFQMT